MCVCGGICTNKLLSLRLFDFRHVCNHYCQDVSNFICTDRRTCRKSWASLKNLVEMLKWYTCSLLIWKCNFGFRFLYTVIQWFRWNTCIFEESSVSFYPSQPEILKWLIWREVMHVDLTHCHCGTDIIY